MTNVFTIPFICWTLRETLENIQKSHVARLLRISNRHRVFSRKTTTLLSKDKKKYVRGFTENVKSCLNWNDLRLAFQTLKKLHTTFPSKVSTIRKANGQMIAVNAYRSHWAKYFEQLNMAKPPNGQLPLNDFFFFFTVMETAQRKNKPERKKSPRAAVPESPIE